VPVALNPVRAALDKLVTPSFPRLQIVGKFLSPSRAKAHFFSRVTE
jgi:hypothetical protein